jgi:hypothetical protein
MQKNADTTRSYKNPIRNTAGSVNKPISRFFHDQMSKINRVIKLMPVTRLTVTNRGENRC